MKLVCGCCTYVYNLEQTTNEFMDESDAYVWEYFDKLL